MISQSASRLCHNDGNQARTTEASSEWIMLNVGGQLFTTTRTTLCTNEPNSMLARMFSQHQNYHHRHHINNHQRDNHQHQHQHNCEPTADDELELDLDANNKGKASAINESNNNNIITHHQDLCDDHQRSQHQRSPARSKGSTSTSTTTASTTCTSTTSATTSTNPTAMITSSSSYSLRPSPRDANGAYLIDRSPKYFEPILNYLRHGKLILDHNVNVQGVLEEAKFYGIVSLLPMLELETDRLFKKRHQELVQAQLAGGYDSQLIGLGAAGYPDCQPGGADGTQLQTLPALTRQDVIKALMSTSGSTAELRFQGCNLMGANLSKLDLRHINLKYANLRNSNLKGANLSYANLERADLFQSNLEGAQLIGTNLASANLENSNLRAVTVMDPNNDQTKPKTSFESANLKNTNFEGSQLAQCNLRVANLRGSNLQNCDLSKATLVRADLENCDLSGCQLNEANLRGANFKGTQRDL